MFEPVAKIEEIPEGSGKVVTAGTKKVLVMKIDGELRAVVLRDGKVWLAV